MFESFLKRENLILTTLQKFIDEQLEFIIVGGYAVSSYKHRFSIDADIIIQDKDKQKFESILHDNGFVKTIRKELEHVYAPEFIRYETQNKLPVSFDLLINGIGSRTTNGKRDNVHSTRKRSPHSTQITFWKTHRFSRYCSTKQKHQREKNRIIFNSWKKRNHKGKHKKVIKITQR